MMAESEIITNIKRNGVFKHAQNAQNRFIPRMRSLIRAFALNWYIL